jgi:hypothetical protein
MSTRRIAATLGLGRTTVLGHLESTAARDVQQLCLRQKDALPVTRVT